MKASRKVLTDRRHRRVRRRGARPALLRDGVEPGGAVTLHGGSTGPDRQPAEQAGQPTAVAGAVGGAASPFR